MGSARNWGAAVPLAGASNQQVNVENLVPEAVARCGLSRAYLATLVGSVSERHRSLNLASFCWTSPAQPLGREPLFIVDLPE